MKSLLSTIVLCALVSSVIGQYDDVCLWYRETGTNTQLNGKYVYTGTHNSHPYYLMSSDDCSLPTLYLYYWTGNYWFISPTLGDNTYYAQCETSGLDLPTDCGTNWKFGGDTDTDTQTTVEVAPCPALECSQVKFEYTNNNINDDCVGIYDTKVTGYDNAYYQSTASKDTYLYFNEKVFKWMCYSEITISSCITYWGIASGQEWYDIPQGEYTTFLWSNTYQANITCLGSKSPTNQQTPTPTQKPTTDAPTSQATTDDLCLWYRGEESETDTNTALNGKYLYTGNYNNKYYYSMNVNDCEFGTVYLYYYSSSNQWFIGETLGSNQYYAKCETTSIDNPIDCGNNWLFGSESDVDPKAEVMVAPCPSVDCPYGINLYYTDTSTDLCNVEYSTILGDNAFERNEGFIQVYLYFNEKAFRWVCASSYNASSCYTYLTQADAMAWYDLDESNSVELAWPSYYDTSRTGVLECLSQTVTDSPTTAVGTPTTVQTLTPTGSSSGNPGQTGIQTDAPTDSSGGSSSNTPSPTSSNSNPVPAPTGTSSGGGTSSNTITPVVTGSGGTAYPTTDSGGTGNSGTSSSGSGDSGSGDSGSGDSGTGGSGSDDSGDSGSGNSGSSTSSSSKNSGSSLRTMPWWGWLIIAILAIVLVGLAMYIIGMNRGQKQSDNQYRRMDDNL